MKNLIQGCVLAAIVILSRTSFADVFSNVAEAAAEGYQVLYELNIPTDGGFRDATPVPYAVDNSLTALPFDRVAYYLELVNADGTSRWVYVSVDAFTNVARELGLPHNVLNPVSQRRCVENLNIFSNVAGIQTGISLDGGSLEMWPSNYTQARGGLFYAGNGGTYDWDDAGGTSDPGYGSFQVHRPIARQVLLAYNHWGTTDGTPDDVGIGNQSSGQPDYTFAGNAGNFAARKLVILTRPGQHVSFSAVPKNRAVVPRDLATSDATVAFAGTEREGGYVSAVLRTYRNGVFLAEQTQALTYTETIAPFALSRQIPAELASYDFEFLLEKAGVLRLVRRVTDVVAGDVYLFYGQSNAEAGLTFSPNNQSSNGYAGPWVRTFGQNADSGDATRNNLSWVPANGDGAGSNFVDPGAVGQWALVVGSKIVSDHGIPVAIINGARGGATMGQLQKDDLRPDNLDNDPGDTRWRIYNRLRYRAIQGGIAAKARALFYYQGESDADNAQIHAAGFDALYADWQVDYPGLEHIYEVQVRPGCNPVTVGNVALRQTQRAFGDQYEHVSVMATNGIEAHDGCHYRFTNGYEVLGLHHFRQVSRDLYGGPSGPNIDALNPAMAYFIDGTHTRIAVAMRDTGATINFPAAALGDFALVGTSANLTSRTVEGSTIIFTLDQPAVGSPVLEYRSHLGAGSWITNANSVGLLSFAEPVLLPGPQVTLVNPPRSQEANPGDTISVIANSDAGPGGQAVLVVLYANGVEQARSTGTSLTTTWKVPAAGAHQLRVRAFDAGGDFGEAVVSILAGSNASPGGVATGLRIWMKAERGVLRDSTSTVFAWQDQSGNNYHAMQTIAASRPTYTEGLFGLGAGLRFDGGDFLTSNLGMPTGSYTKIVRFFAIGTGLSHNLISSNVQGAAAARDHAFYVPQLIPTIFHSGSQVGSAQPVASGAATIAVCTFDATSREAKVYINGALSNTGTLDGPNTVAGFQLGAYVNANNLTGGIAEVIVYDHVLSDVERTAIFDYLDNRYRTPFGLWLKNHLGANGGAGDDPRHDGLVAVVEYALGLDPAQNNSGTLRLPQVTRTGDTIAVTYTRATDRPDVLVQLESSAGLATWTRMSDAPVATAGNLETRRFTVSSGSEQAYFRLHIQVP